jgi:hypothetical protein
MSTSLRIYTLVYGETHLRLFQTALARSLAWPQNKEELRNAHWHIFGRLEDTQRVYEIATQVLPCSQIELKPMRITANQTDPLACVMDVMRMCLLEQVPMLMAPPDTIFGDGAVKALMTYGRHQGTCVSMCHPRVLPELTHHLTNIPPTNPQFVRLALAHPHKSWVQSARGSPANGSRHGGIYWQSIDENTIAVQHRLPTIYLANFTDEDRKFFSRPQQNSPPQIGLWDWLWPSDLIRTERLRHIGSSDAAFACEVTESWKNVPQNLVVNPREPDAFFADGLHFKINRQYVSCFRRAGI